MNMEVVEEIEQQVRQLPQEEQILLLERLIHGLRNQGAGLQSDRDIPVNGVKINAAFQGEMRETEQKSAADESEEPGDPDTLSHAIKLMTERTPEEILQVQQRILQSSPPPRALPPGQTLADVVIGRWPGDEIDEQIDDALEKLS